MNFSWVLKDWKDDHLSTIGLNDRLWQLPSPIELQKRFSTKAVPLLFLVTSIVVFLQLLSGWLLTFNFIGPEFHIITGIIVLGMTIATMIFSLTTKSSFGSLRGISTGMVALIAVQIILGLETL